MWWVEINSGVRVPSGEPAFSSCFVVVGLLISCAAPSPHSSIKMPELETQQNSSLQLLRESSEETGS